MTYSPVPDNRGRGGGGGGELLKKGGCANNVDLESRMMWTHSVQLLKREFYLLVMN